MKKSELLIALLWLFIYQTNVSAENQTQNVVISEGFIQTDDGYRLFYRKAGSGKEAVIIPLDVFTFDGLQSLARKDRTLVFYDPRNRGRSSSVEDLSKISVENDLKDIDAVRRHFNFERFSLIGYSVFGMEVALYASRFPDQIVRLVQLGPVPLKFGTQYPKELDNTSDQSVYDETIQGELKKLQASHYDETHPQEYCYKETRFYSNGLVATQEGLTRIRKTLENSCRFRNEWPVNFRKQLEAHFRGSVLKLSVSWDKIHNSMRMPVLVIHGKKDRNAPYGAGREWASRLANAKLLTVENGAHQSWEDQPEIVIGAISEFLDGKWPSAAAAGMQNE